MKLRRIGEALGLVSRVPRARCLAPGSRCVAVEYEGGIRPIWLDRIKVRDDERALEVLTDLLPQGSIVQLPGLRVVEHGLLEVDDVLTESGHSASRQLVQAGVAEWRD